MKKIILLISLAGIMMLTACGAPAAATPSPAPTFASLKLTSPAFADGQPIPVVYSCVGKSTSPALNWGEPPAGTKSFALIMDDPSAPHGTFLHWIYVNIPATSRGLSENVTPTAAPLPDGSLQGNNGLDTPGYVGPCPPTGTHRYSFRLYALDTSLNSPFNMSKDELYKTIDAHTLAKAELIGTFKK